MHGGVVIGGGKDEKPGQAMRCFEGAQLFSRGCVDFLAWIPALRFVDLV